MATGTMTHVSTSDVTRAGVRVYRWDWTSSAAGIATDPTAAARVTGFIYQVKFTPDGVNATKGTIKLISGSSRFDYLMDVGASFPVTATSTGNIRTPLTPDGTYINIVNASLVPEVTNTGISKSGTIHLYVKES
jgi:hypothetical protein